MIPILAIVKFPKRHVHVHHNLNFAISFLILMTDPMWLSKVQLCSFYVVSNPPLYIATTSTNTNDDNISIKKLKTVDKQSLDIFYTANIPL